MSRTIRLYIALMILIAAVALLLAGRFWQTGAADSTAAPPEVANATFTHTDCRECHQEVWQEWEASHHASAFSSNAVQAAFRHFGHDRKCESCHAPQPVLITGLESPVALRTGDRQSGVHCLSCHALPSGKVAAARTLPDAPCQPTSTPELIGSKSCGLCHTAIYDDWLGSRYEQEGKTCQACHMPAESENLRRHSHACPGGHDLAFIQSGANMTVVQEQAEVIARVTNHATGHNFPGERHNRVLFLQVTMRDRDNQITLNQETIIKDITPFRGESSAEKIQIDETFEAKFPIVENSTLAVVRLLYKPFPWYSQSDAMVLFEEPLELQANESRTDSTEVLRNSPTS